MRKLFTIAALLCLGAVFAQETGTIAGKLLDKESNNQPLPFANVVVQGTSKGSSTDFDGLFEITGVPVGTYTIEFSFTGYQTVEIPNVVVEADKVAVLDATMGATAAALDEVVIKVITSREREEALLIEQKNAIEIKQAIGAQELARKGVSDAEAAVTKITGVTKQQGEKNVFVRGLGDRYNSTSLNGLPLPSDNPTYKNITLDLFSSDIIKTIGVSKVFGSRLYGDVAGANIDIESKEIVGKEEFKVSISTGINTETVGEDNFLVADGANGFGTGLDKDFPLTDLTQYNFENSLDPDTQSSQFNSGIAISGGKKFDIGENRLSVFLVGGFDNDYQFKDGFSKQINATGGFSRNLDVQQYEYNVSQKLMGNFKYSFGNGNYLAINSIYLHDNTQSVSDYFGQQDSVSDDPDRPTYIRRQQTNNNNIFINQLLGYFNITDKLTLDFGGSYSNARSDEPDRRQNTFLRINGEFRTTTGSAGLNHRFFSQLDEDDIAGKAIITYDLNTSDSHDTQKINTIELGVNYRNTERQFDFIQYSTNFNSQILVDRNNVDALFNQQSIDDGTFSLVTDRGRADNPNALTPFFYSADRTIISPFGSTTLSLVDNLTVSLGLRLDNVEQTVDYDTELISSVSNPPSGPTGVIEENYILPSMSLKYNFSENSILRLAGSKTYTLPQFIEVAPFLYEDVNFSRFGNPLLQASDDYNVDLKYEWYPKSGEIIAITGFFKYIDFPINTIEVNSAGNDISFVNTPEATAFGVELEIRKDIFNIDVGEDASGNNKLTAGLNISYLNTNQTLEDVDTDELTVRYTNDKDELSGASDLLINADITYNINRPKYDLLSSVVFNYFSDRIFTIGVAGRENIVETGIPTLDFINKIKLGEHFGISLSAKNLLNPDFKLTQDTTAGETIDLTTYKKGVNISAGISYEF